MSLSPLELQKATFRRVLRGWDPTEVEDYLEQVGEELAARNHRIQQLQIRVQELEEALTDSASRERELQRVVVQAQRVAETMTGNAKREAEVIVREAEVTAERIVRQALEQITSLEGRINSLRISRQEMQLKLKASIELYQQVLERDNEEDVHLATLRYLPTRGAQSDS